MKKILLILVLIFNIHSVRAETVESFYTAMGRNQLLFGTFLDAFYHGIFSEKYKDPKLAQEKYDICQKKLSTMDFILGFKILYAENKVDKEADIYDVFYRILNENCLNK